MKHTKKALFTSIVALLLCFTMLMGTTFAWFTDTATVKVNKIQAGNLDVELYGNKVSVVNGVSTVGEEIDYNKETQAAADALWASADGDLWEPGFTSYRIVKLVNAGNLAFEYAVDITSNGKTKDVADPAHPVYSEFNLSDVIDVYFDIIEIGKTVPTSFTTGDYKDYTPVGKLSSILGVTEKGVINGVLLPADSDADETAFERKGEVYAVIALHMQESAGNDYQHLSQEFDIMVWAKQWTEEFDSTTDQYDKNAAYDENRKPDGGEEGGEGGETEILYSSVKVDGTEVAKPEYNKSYEYTVPTREGYTVTATLDGAPVAIVDGKITIANVNKESYEIVLTYTAEKTYTTVTVKYFKDGVEQTDLAETYPNVEVGSTQKYTPQHDFNTDTVEYTVTPETWEGAVTENLVIEFRYLTEVEYAAVNLEVYIGEELQTEYSKTLSAKEIVGTTYTMKDEDIPAIAHHTTDSTTSVLVAKGGSTITLVYTKTPAAKASADITVNYNFPGLTGVTLTLTDAEGAPVANATTEAEAGTATFTVEDLVANASYTVTATFKDTTFNTASVPASVTVTLNEAENKYTAENVTVDLKTGYTRTIINEDFEGNTSSVVDPDADWKGEVAVSTDTGVFYGTGGLKLTATTLNEGQKVALATSGDKWGGQDAVRTPKFSMVKDRIYVITTTMNTIAEPSPEYHTWTNDTGSNSYIRIYDTYVDDDNLKDDVEYMLTFKDNDNGYQWHPEGYWAWDTLPEGITASTLTNLTGNAEQKLYNEKSVWGTYTMTFIPKQDISDIRADISVESPGSTQFNYVYNDVTYAEAYFTPHFYVDSIVITEIVPNP